MVSLILKRWYACGVPELAELEFGLQNAKATMGGISLSVDVCNQQLQDAFSKVPCEAGTASLGLGATGAALMGLAVVFAGVIAYNRRLGGLWGGALSVNLLGGVLAIVSGATYVARMSDLASDLGFGEACAADQAAPILMIAGRSTNKWA